MNTPQERIAEAAKIAFADPFDAVLRIEIEQTAPADGGEDGASPTLTIDGRTTPPGVFLKAAALTEPDCVWRGKADTLLRVLETERALESAFVSGRLTITGDMSVMARLTINQADTSGRT